jgi:hypothetical protein
MQIRNTYTAPLEGAQTRMRALLPLLLPAPLLPFEVASGGAAKSAEMMPSTVRVLPVPLMQEEKSPKA